VTCVYVVYLIVDMMVSVTWCNKVGDRGAEWQREAGVTRGM